MKKANAIVIAAARFQKLDALIASQQF